MKLCLDLRPGIGMALQIGVKQLVQTGGDDVGQQPGQLVQDGFGGKMSAVAREFGAARAIGDGGDVPAALPVGGEAEIIVAKAAFPCMGPTAQAGRDA